MIPRKPRKPRKPAVAAPANTSSLYLRLSRESTEEGTGLRTREADLRALAAARGLTIVAVSH